MLNLLQFEFRRLFRKTSFYVCLAITVLLVLYALGAVAQRYLNVEQYSSSLIPIRPTMIVTLNYSLKIANLSVMAGVFSALYICEDKARGTIKNIYSLGYSRTHLFFAKYLASATAVSIMYAVVILITFIGGVLMNADFSPQRMGLSMLYEDSSAKEISVLTIVVQQYFSIMALHSFYYMVSELVGNTGPSVVLNIFAPLMLYIAFMMIFSAVLSFITQISDNSEAILALITSVTEAVTIYWLPTMITFVADLAGGFGDMDYGISIIVNIGYIIIFGALALLITRKKQVKN